MGATAVLLFSGFYFTLPVLPLYLHENFGTDKTGIGLLMGAFTLATLLSRPLIGHLLDRGHKRALYLATLFLFAAFSLPYAFAPGLASVLALRILQGLAWGGTTTCGASLVVDFIPPARRGEGLGIYGLSMTFAMAIGPLAALSLLGQGHFTRVFVAAAVAGFLALGVLLLVRFPKEAPREHAKPFGLGSFIEPRVAPLSLSLFFLTFTYGGLLAFVPLYASERRIAHAGVFFLVFAAGLAAARLFSGRFYDRRGPVGLGIFSMLTLAGGFALLSLWKGAAAFYLTAAIIGLGQGLVNPLFQAMINDLVPRDRRGAANSTFFTAFDGGIGAGMLATGALADAVGLSGAFLVSAACCLVALALFAAVSLPHFERHRLPRL
ncbi:MAG: MFS transporter [Spirochaetes bacterium]|nr:MFS transporter [Spirochaetota bacterium]